MEPNQMRIQSVLGSPESPVQETQEAGNMISSREFEQVMERWKTGWRKKAIARALGLDPKTVRKYIGEGQRQGYRRTKPRASLLDAFRARAEQRMVEVNYQAQVLYVDLKEHGYAGGYDVVRRFVKPFRDTSHRLIEATVRFETGPGQQAQVDWGTVSLTVGGIERRVQLFAMVLGFSRRLFVQATWDQTLPTLIGCHEMAFAHFGGLTATHLYDNMKTVVLKRDTEGQHITWHPLFKDFADYWGFTPRLCRFYRAQTKGKIESGVKYVKRNFFALRGTTFRSLEHLNEELGRWMGEIADQRLHGTTHERPCDRFTREELRPLPAQAAYQLETLLTRTVPHDALVVFRTNRYSVPWTSVGRRVTLVEVGEAVKIFDGTSLLAEHPRRAGRFESAVLPAHYEGLLARRPAGGSTGRVTTTGGEDVQVRDLAIYEALTTGRLA